MNPRYRPLAATTLIFVIAYAICISQYPGMWSTRVFGNFLTDNAFLGIAAVGATFVIISGGIDLSVGAVIGLTGVITAILISWVGIHPLAVFAIVIVGLVALPVLPVVLGMAVHRRVPSFSARMEKPMKIFSAVVLAAFVGTASSFLAFAALAAKRGLETTAHGRKSFFYSTGIAEGTETIIVFILCCLWPAHFPTIALAYAGLCILTVPTAPSDFLVEGLRTLGQLHVNHLPHIGLIDSHTKSRGRNHGSNTSGRPGILQARALFGRNPSVVGCRRNSISL